MLQHIRSVMFLAGVLATSAAWGMSEAELIGIWRTVDSSHTAAIPKAAIFRKDGTGAFLSPDVQLEGDAFLKDAANRINDGNTDQAFKYSMEQGELVVNMTHFGRIPVSPGQPPARFALDREGTEIKLTILPARSHWLKLKKAD